MVVTLRKLVWRDSDNRTGNRRTVQRDDYGDEQCHQSYP